MNKAISLLVLIHSMTKAEKRYFKLYSNLQEGDKVYLRMFSLMEECASVGDVARRFSLDAGESSFDIAVKHLYKVVVDCLLHLRGRYDIQARISGRMAEAEILFRCGLLQAATEELGRAKKLARQYEQSALLMLIRQTELRYLSAGDFQAISEKQLVEKQMKVNETFKYLRSANQHMQLYDILKYRSLYRSKVRSEQERQSLNDLVLSELHLIANNSYKGFEVDKLHQLFQSAYFLQSGNYKAAILIYRQLLELFDQNPGRMLNPPLHYLDAVLGVLDSLLSAGLYDEMPFFIAKLRQLAESDYPQDFVRKVQAFIYIYDSFRLINSGAFAGAQGLYGEYEEVLFRKLSQQKLDVQLTLQLNQAVLHLACGRNAEARRVMSRIQAAGLVFYNFPAFRIARLVNLLLQVECGRFDLVENEIKSIRRTTSLENSSVEKMVFRFVRLYPLPDSRRERTLLWERLCGTVRAVAADKFERPLLKYFDFTAWVETRLTGAELADILVRNTRLQARQYSL